MRGRAHWDAILEKPYTCKLAPPGSVVVNFHNTAPWMKLRELPGS
jgi:hypothetical protein